jgi:hypothetical protein
LDGSSGRHRRIKTCLNDGDAEGFIVGVKEGIMLGMSEGVLLGLELGAELGRPDSVVDPDVDGRREGAGVGSMDSVGETEGEKVGESDGDADGRREGGSDGSMDSVGDTVGEKEGKSVGACVGAIHWVSKALQFDKRCYPPSTSTNESDDCSFLIAIHRPLREPRSTFE